jgi:hypothetical protein
MVALYNSNRYCSFCSSELMVLLVMYCTTDKQLKWGEEKTFTRV